MDDEREGQRGSHELQQHHKHNDPPKPPAPPTPPTPPPTPPTPGSTATYTLVTEPDQGLTPIYNLLASAKKSIDMTMYELTDVTVVDALANAAAAGLAVRVIL